MGKKIKVNVQENGSRLENFLFAYLPSDCCNIRQLSKDLIKVLKQDKQEG